MAADQQVVFDIISRAQTAGIDATTAALGSLNIAVQSVSNSGTGFDAAARGLQAAGAGATALATGAQTAGAAVQSTTERVLELATSVNAAANTFQRSFEAGIAPAQAFADALTRAFSDPVASVSTLKDAIGGVKNDLVDTFHAIVEAGKPVIDTVTGEEKAVAGLTDRVRAATPELGDLAHGIGDTVDAARPFLQMLPVIGRGLDGLAASGSAAYNAVGSGFDQMAARAEPAAVAIDHVAEAAAKAAKEAADLAAGQQKLAAATKVIEAQEDAWNKVRFGTDAAAQAYRQWQQARQTLDDLGTSATKQLIQEESRLKVIFDDARQASIGYTQQASTAFKELISLQRLLAVYEQSGFAGMTETDRLRIEGLTKGKDAVTALTDAVKAQEEVWQQTKRASMEYRDAVAEGLALVEEQRVAQQSVLTSDQGAALKAEAAALDAGTKARERHALALARSDAAYRALSAAQTAVAEANPDMGARELRALQEQDAGIQKLQASYDKLAGKTSEAAAAMTSAMQTEVAAIDAARGSMLPLDQQIAVVTQRIKDLEAEQEKLLANSSMNKAVAEMAIFDAQIAKVTEDIAKAEAEQRKLQAVGGRGLFEGDAALAAYGAKVTAVTKTVEDLEIARGNLQRQRASVELESKPAMDRATELRNELIGLRTTLGQLTGKPVAIDLDTGPAMRKVDGLRGAFGRWIDSLRDQKGFDLPKSFGPGLDALRNMISGADRSAGSLNLGAVSSMFAQIGNSLSGLGQSTNLVTGFGTALQAVGSIATPTGLAIGLAGAAIVAIGAQAVGAAAQMEKFTVQFEILLGSADLAQQRISGLQQLGQIIPLPTDELIEASRQLEIFGGSLLASTESLEVLANISATTGSPISQLGENFGRLFKGMKEGTGEMSYVIRSFERLGVLPEKGQKALKKLEQAVLSGTKNMAEAWPEVLAVFDKFQGAAERVGDTFAGAQQKVANSAQFLLSTVGNLILPVVTDITNAINAALGMVIAFVNAVGKVFAPVFAAFDNFSDKLSGDLITVLTAITNGLNEVAKAAESFWREAKKVGDAFAEWVSAIPVIKQIADALAQMGGLGATIGATFDLIFAAILAKLAWQAAFFAAGTVAGLAWKAGFAAAAFIVGMFNAFFDTTTGMALIKGGQAGVAWTRGFELATKAKAIGNSIGSALGGGIGAALKTTLAAAAVFIAIDLATTLWNNTQDTLTRLGELKLKITEEVPTDSVEALQAKALALQQGIKSLEPVLIASQLIAGQGGGYLTGAAQNMDAYKASLAEVTAQLGKQGVAVAKLGDAEAEAANAAFLASEEHKNQLINQFTTLPGLAEAAWKTMLDTQKQWQDDSLVLTELWAKLTSKQLRDNLASENPKTVQDAKLAVEALLNEYNSLAEFKGLKTITAEDLGFGDDTTMDGARRAAEFVAATGKALDDALPEAAAKSHAAWLQKGRDDVIALYTGMRDEASKASGVFDQLFADLGDPTTSMAGLLAKQKRFTATLGLNISDAMNAAAGAAIDTGKKQMDELAKLMTPAQRAEAETRATELGARTAVSYFEGLESEGVRGSEAIRRTLAALPEAATNSAAMAKLRNAAKDQMITFMEAAADQGKNLRQIYAELAATWPTEIEKNKKAIYEAAGRIAGAIGEGIRGKRNAIDAAIDQVNEDLANAFSPAKERKRLREALAFGFGKGQKGLIDALKSKDPAAQADAAYAISLIIKRYEEANGDITKLTGDSKKTINAYNKWLETHPLDAPGVTKGEKPETPVVSEAPGVPAATAAATQEVGVQLATQIGVGMVSPAAISKISEGMTVLVDAAKFAVSSAANVASALAAGMTMADNVLNGVKSKNGSFAVWGSNAGYAYVNGIATGIDAAMLPGGPLDVALNKVAETVEAGSPPGPKSPLHKIDVWGYKTTEAYMGGMVKGLEESAGLNSALSRLGSGFGVVPTAGMGGIARGVGDTISGSESTDLLRQIVAALGLNNQLTARGVATDPVASGPLAARSLVDELAFIQSGA